MSLSSALSNALSGLTASSRGASVISSNLANVLTEGYAVRDLSLSSRSSGSDGGVMINGVTRLVDHALLRDRRLADGAQADAQTRSGYLSRLAVLTGDPTDGQSLTGLMAEFESSLITAASMPESETRLELAVSAASALTDHLNSLSLGVQSLRTEADQSIAKQVDRLNVALKNVEELNRDIISARAQGREIAGLMDQRQALVDEISAIVPVQELQRDMGAIALMTPGGAVLLDGQAAAISFTAHHTVGAQMSLENGLLSGLQINGSDVSARDGAAMSGGSLGAQFAARDDILPAIQAELDTIALDLIERFGGGLDGTIAATAPGLFTDSGGSAGNLTGISGRISLNALADPEQGGAAWRLRDGLGATVQSSGGNASLLQALQNALTAQQVPTAPHLGGASRDAKGLVSDFMSAIGNRETQTDKELSFAAARQSELQEMELALGVDSDLELQKLMLVERAYAANAKIVQAVDDMLQQLMEIG